MSASRNRTEGGMVAGKQVKIFETNGFGVRTNTAILNGVRTGFYNTMSDTVVDNFHARVAAGEVFFNPMSSTKRRLVSNSQGYMQSPYTIAPGETQLRITEVDGNWLDVYVPKDAYLDYVFINQIQGDYVSDMCNEVSTKVLADRGVGPSNIWESLAEAQQTVSLAATLNTSVLKLLAQHFHKYGLASGATLPASAYLSFRYGIKPLLSDFETALNGLTNTLRKKRVQTRAKLEEKRVTTTPYTAQGPGSIANHYHSVRKHKVVVRGLSLDEHVTSRMHEIGLSAKGLLTVGYDLIWMSFVADWFLTLGDYIKSLVPAVGFDNLGSCLTIQHILEDEWVCDGSANGTNFQVVRPISGNLIAAYEYKIRRSLTKPVTSIRRNFRFHLATRVGDSLALTATTLARAFPVNKTLVNKLSKVSGS